MTDTSGYGLRLNLRASQTFPTGINLTQFADDQDPFDLPSIQVTDKAMGLNGDLITWSKANPIITSVALIPGTDDDRNMAVLLEANRVGKGKSSVQDVITLTGVYPDGRTITLTEGRITDGMPGNGVSSAGRLKSKTYSFVFENKVES
jgi:hypothetical protein